MSAVILLLVAVLALPSESTAHAGGAIWPIYEIPTADLPDLSDGSLEDWEAVLPNASLTHEAFQPAFDSRPLDPESLVWRVFLGWHFESQRIYVAVERLDDDYVTVAKDTFGVERMDFMVDGDHSGGQFSYFLDGVSEEDQRRLHHVQAQQYMVRSDPHPGEIYIWNPGLRTSWPTQAPWTEIGAVIEGERPARSIVEFSITPWDHMDFDGAADSRRSVLRPGNIVGFAMTMSDVDDYDSRTIHGFTLGPAASASSTSADAFLDGELIPCHVADCSRARPSAVVNDSWGRIKAGLLDR